MQPTWDLSPPRTAGGPGATTTDHLAATVSHDLNNLLTVVLSHAELMRERVTNQEDAESLDIIIETVEGAAEITGQLLIYPAVRQS